MSARPLLLAAALAALLPAVAAAQTRTIAEAGGWRAFAGTTNNGGWTCGMDVVSPDDRRFLIQHYAGDNHLTVRAFRASWQIPQGTRIPVRAQIGGAAWTATASGSGPELRWVIDMTTMNQWETAFRAGSLLVLTFQGGGSEAPWRINLTGSNTISDAFVRCLRAAGGTSAGATQPFASTPTQPQGSPAAPPQPAVSPRGQERRT